jgi:hypothetical protein
MGVWSTWIWVWLASMASGGIVWGFAVTPAR